MVRLTRIYTRGGDDGSTGLGDGSRVPKDNLRVEAYGCVDELCAQLGVTLSAHEFGTDALRELRSRLERIQNDLYDLGADLCLPDGAEEAEEQATPLRMSDPAVERLEAWIDGWNAELAPLESFLLPGGDPAAASLHLARTVCRRAERRISSLIGRGGDAVNPVALRYLNRLSDLLFVMARVAGKDAEERHWIPGGAAD